MGSAMGFPFMSPVVGTGLVLLMLWTLAWKGLALWRAAQRGDTIWFLVLLVLNTVGILEIIYLFFITGAKLSDFTAPLAKKRD